MKKLTCIIKINSEIDKIWFHWNDNYSIEKWNIPFSDWKCQVIENNLKVGGKFDYRMGNIGETDGFNYKGQYTNIIVNELIETLGDDNRPSQILFKTEGKQVTIIETFEPESKTPIDIQEEFINTILTKFKNFVENK